MEQYPTIDVKEFVVRSRVLELFQSVRYNDPDLKNYILKRRFPVSIPRLYEYDKFQELAQIEVNQDKARVSREAASSSSLFWPRRSFLISRTSGSIPVY